MKQKEEDAINAADGDGGRATAVSDSPRSCASIDYDGIDNWQMSGGADAGGGEQMSRPRPTDGRTASFGVTCACVGLFKITKNQTDSHKMPMPADKIRGICLGRVLELFKS